MSSSYSARRWAKLGAEAAGPAEPLARVGLALQSSLNPSSVVGRLCDTLSELLRLERCIVFEKGEPSDPLFVLVREAFARKEVVQADGPKSILCAPLISERYPEGAIVAERAAADPFEPSDLSLLAAVAPQAALAVRRARLYDRATTDDVTGLPNRQRFTVELEDAVQAGGGLGLLLVDIDHFKDKNEVYGRAVGNRVLGELGELLLGRLPGASCVARTDEDEFSALLPEHEAAQVREIAEDLRHGVDDRIFDERHEGIHLTVSCGLAELSPGEMASSLFSRAADALARAKRSGRNRVEAAR